MPDSSFVNISTYKENENSSNSESLREKILESIEEFRQKKLRQEEGEKKFLEKHNIPEAVIILVSKEKRQEISGEYTSGFFQLELAGCPVISARIVPEGQIYAALPEYAYTACYKAGDYEAAREISKIMTDRSMKALAVRYEPVSLSDLDTSDDQDWLFKSIKYGYTWFKK